MMSIVNFSYYLLPLSPCYRKLISIDDYCALDKENQSAE